MLISFLLRPAAFDKACIVDKASAASARLLLRDILDAGIIIDFSDRRLLDGVVSTVEGLEPQLKQHLLILLDEIKKQRKMVVATPMNATTRSEDALVNELRPDAMLVAPSAAQGHGIEAIAIGDYLDSNARKKRERFGNPDTPAAHRNFAELDESLGRFLKYARTVAVLDKMIGHSGRDGRLGTRFVAGLRFVASCWQRHSVYNTGTLELIVVTAAGETGARGGYIDPIKVRTAIDEALSDIGATVKTVIKQDSSPPTFHARFLRAKGRCIKVDPGIDGLAHGGKHCACLLIDPPCRADNAMAGEVMRLPELGRTGAGSG